MMDEIEKEFRDVVEVAVVEGPEGMSLYVDNKRVAGSKPWGGGRVIHSFRASSEPMLKALGGERLLGVQRERDEAQAALLSVYGHCYGHVEVPRVGEQADAIKRYIDMTNSERVEAEGRRKEAENELCEYLAALEQDEPAAWLNEMLGAERARAEQAEARLSEAHELLREIRAEKERR